MPQTVNLVTRASTGASSTLPVITGKTLLMEVACQVTGTSVQLPPATGSPMLTVTFFRTPTPATLGPTAAAPSASMLGNHFRGPLTSAAVTASIGFSM